MARCGSPFRAAARGAKRRSSSIASGDGSSASDNASAPARPARVARRYRTAAARGAPSAISTRVVAGRHARRLRRSAARRQKRRRSQARDRSGSARARAGGASGPAAELAAKHGLAHGPISIRNQRSRWGSCARTGNIALNYRLVQMPPAVRDYVLVHELMHLRQQNHSRRFWKLVATACPQYRDAERWLRVEGQALF